MQVLSSAFEIPRLASWDRLIPGGLSEGGFLGF